MLKIGINRGVGLLPTPSLNLFKAVMRQKDLRV